MMREVRIQLRKSLVVFTYTYIYRSGVIIHIPEVDAQQRTHPGLTAVMHKIQRRAYIIYIRQRKACIPHRLYFVHQLFGGQRAVRMRVKGMTIEKHVRQLSGIKIIAKNSNMLHPKMENFQSFKSGKRREKFWPSKIEKWRF
jgi:hypothetical protein